MKIWKKYLSLMLSLALCLCLAACGDAGTVDDTSDGSSWEDSSAPDSSPISYMGKSTIQQNS